MQNLLDRLSLACGTVGALLCLASGISRLTGAFLLGGFEASTLFLGGTGLMVFAILLKLQLIHAAVLAERSQR